MTTPGLIQDLVGVGLLCCHLRDSGFKLALIVGYPRDPSNKLRVRYWRAVSACWTEPQLVKQDQLRMLVEDDYTKRRRVIKLASEEALAHRFAKRVWS